MTKLNRSLPRQFWSRAIKLSILTLVLAAIGAAGTSSVRADVKVQGDVSAVRVDASKAPIAEVLSALGAAFKFRYRTSTSLEDTISGTYTGQLREVISRVLDRYSYVVKNKDQAIEVVIVGRKGARAVPVDTKPETARSLAREWRTPTK